MSTCHLNAAELSVAKAMRGSIVENVNERRRACTADSVWWSLGPNWTEAKTPLRTWSAEKQCYEYLRIITQDLQLNRNTTSSAVADQLICGITGVADPWEKVDLNTASPYAKQWVEGVFKRLGTREPKSFKQVTEREAC